VRSAGADAAACPPTVSPASGRWDDAKRAALRTALAAQGHDRLERIVANFDELQRDIDDHWEATCKAVRSGALTADQANQRRSCLERREIELGVKVDHFIRAKPNEPTLVERAQVFNVAACDELALPPLPTDREPVIALYRKLIATEDMRTPDRIAPVQEIERAAAVLGERELEMRAMLLAGIWQSDSGQLAAAEESLKRAYQASVDRRSVLVQTVALTMRARVADLKGEAREAMSFASLARELADRPTTPTAARARVYYQLAHAAIDRGEAAAATEYVKRALEIVHQDRHPLPFVEAGIRIDTVRALGMYEGHKREAIAAAREGVAWMKQAFGEHSVNHAKMLGQLASALRWNNEIVEALAIYRRSVALMIESSPPGDPSILLAKGDLARHLEANGLFEEARELWAEELAAAPHNEMVRAYLPLITVRLGVSTCAVGRCAEGYPQIERGLELGIAQYGGDHKNVVEYRDALLDAQLELGKLDDAERNLAVMERIWTKDAQRHARSLAMLNGWARARILIDRKRPAAAEKLVRTALATWQELRGDDGPHAALAYALGLALLEQRRYAEARTALEESARLAASAQQREDFFAELEVALARVDAATGARLRARERAARAREVLARYPMSLHARRDLARLR